MVFNPKQSMLPSMQLLARKLISCAAMMMALASFKVHANVETDATATAGDANANPYATIVDRNPFGLKPPPPPPPPPETTAPPAPMAKVTMTGLLSTFGEPRVLLEIIEDGGKGGAANAKKPILREGERMGPVEILSIDVVKNSVRIRNSGVETNITFPEIVTAKGPTAGGPGVPSAPPPYAGAAFTPPAPLPQPGGNSGGGGGVTLLGGATAASAPGVPSALGSPDGRSIPSRPLRTEQNYNNLPPMTKEQADLLIEANRLRNNAMPNPPPPLPPTSLSPLIEGLQNEHNQQQANPNPSPFPRFPSGPRPAPPIPGR